ncbi:MAG: cytochrome c [Myxococcales bacterium]|nr:cytochrome c [Myxococcales bacterium]
MKLPLGLALISMTVACSRDCPTAPARGAGTASPAAASVTPHDAAPPGNAVQAEMQRLHAALQTTLTGLAYGDVRAAPAAFAEVDHARHATEAALEGGAYQLARNADRLPRFRELDEAFHGALETLVEATVRNDLDTTAAALGPVLRACQPCHGEFRK